MNPRTKIITLITTGHLLLAACAEPAGDRRREPPTTLTEERRTECTTSAGHELLDGNCGEWWQEHHRALRYETTTSRPRPATTRRPAMTCARAITIDANNRDNRWTRSAQHCTESSFRTEVIYGRPQIDCADYTALLKEAHQPVAGWWAGIVLDEC